MATGRAVSDEPTAASGESPAHPAGCLAEIDRQAHDWMVCFSVGRAGPAELAAFQAWSARDPAHVEAFRQACRVWEGIGPASARLADHERASRAAPVRPFGRRAFLGGALAASVGAGVFLAARPPLRLWPSLSELAADHRTAPGEQRHVALTGDVSVALNTRTSIAVKGTPGGVETIELISGEATVAVGPARGGPVTVLAGRGRVTAHDAHFNLRYEDGTGCATCIGNVLEVALEGQSAWLRAGEQVVFSSVGLAAVTAADLAAVTAWNDGMLVFHATPLAAAVIEISRYRAAPIILTNPALGRRLFSARFPIANVEGVVAHIQSVFGATVTRLPAGIVLLG
ncbi:MAG: DUF4880 domain-containing protein [Rhodoplanes sp.]|uniref:FecR family protein n=1 Tax=Rhodoplanes sp. TaxID=1968906 RepID=UPI00182A8E2B|nr:FecR domain-containing protein [Rhodoplanes sp.]NVO13520.1 DUF4880 domain-containing protein [Rhodoplanes sp.]